MSWMAKLYETYEQAISLNLPDDQQLIPLSHSKQNANINIAIDINGKFISAKVLTKTPIILPATEKSAGRTGKRPPPHPLADKLQYVAKDYSPKFGGKKPSFFEAYHTLLKSWCDSQLGHLKAKAVLKYVENGNVIEDLVKAKILFVDDNGCLLTPKSADELKSDVEPLIFNSISKDIETKTFDQGTALVCWSVYIEGDPVSDTWLDTSIQDSWASFDALSDGVEGLCFVTGKQTILASNHPSKIIRAAGNAKLISSNDMEGYTFLGRFTDTKASVKCDGLQAVGVGLLATQKSHNALKWLIRRQGHENGKQVIVSWAVSGKPIPEPMTDSYTLFDWDDLDEIDSSEKVEELTANIDHGRDLGQSFALKLNKKMAGYRAELGDMESIVIMAIDSATSGRVGITYYRECFAKEFIDRLERWHLDFSWQQRHIIDMPQPDGKKPISKTIWPVSAPAPKNIVLAAFGKAVEDDKKKKLLSATIERLLPCIIEERAFPIDIVNSCVRRVSNRNVKRFSGQYSNTASELAAWEKDLGVACALYRGFFNRHPDLSKRRNYAMALETSYHSRDYLYGRLLAIADHIEEMALRIAKENRSTTANRLMQRFSDYPAATWLTIHNGIIPYQQRLKSKIPPLEAAYKRLLEDVHEIIEIKDFNSNEKLTGEYLLGFHCQRKWLREHKLKEGQWILKDSTEDDTDTETETETHEGDE
ncbi:MAG: type I-C CRISPR-associated protein Cas8c/Csd1 [Pseudomonadota bacterium]